MKNSRKEIFETFAQVKKSFLLFKLKLKLSWRNKDRIKGESFLKVSFIGSFIISYLFIGYFLSSKTFHFINAFSVIGPFLIDRLLFVFFFILFSMLTMSSCVVTLSMVFSSKETEYLLQKPLSISSVLFQKFLEVLGISSWAFIFLSLPLFQAYCDYKNLPDLIFWINIFVVIPPFVIICSSIGFSIAIITMRYFWNKFGLILILVTLFTLVSYGFSSFQDRQSFQSQNVVVIMNQMLSYTQWSMHPYSPSRWLAELFLFLNQGRSKPYFVSWNLLLSTSASMFFLMCLLNKYLGFAAWSEMKSVGAKIKKKGIYHWLKNSIFKFVPIGEKEKALLSKDIQVFCRDPLQYAQFLIFFGLILFYLLNLHHMRLDASNPFWKNQVIYLNLGSLSLILCTLLTRFVYPQVSLEGKAIWIIGMSPMKIKKLVETKFQFAFFLSLIVILSLTWLSGFMLKLPLAEQFKMGVSAVVLSYGLSLFAVGFGALFPNFNSTSSAAIVSGFGGTLTLIVSMLYITLFVGVLGILGYFDVKGYIEENNALLYQWGVIVFIVFIFIILKKILLEKGVKSLENELFDGILPR